MTGRHHRLSHLPPALCSVGNSILDDIVGVTPVEALMLAQHCVDVGTSHAEALGELSREFVQDEVASALAELGVTMPQDTEDTGVLTDAVLGVLRTLSGATSSAATSSGATKWS